MSVWKTTPISRTPTIDLVRWQVLRDKDSDYFVGYNITEHEGRVSSRIVSFDSNTHIGITKSGRNYQLIGPPGFDRDADYVITRWAIINSVDLKTVVDVSSEYSGRNVNQEGS